MLLVYPDIYLSRRATLICIFNERDELQWSGKRMLDALAWLRDQETADFVVIGEDVSFGLSLQSVGASTLRADKA